VCGVLERSSRSQPDFDLFYAPLRRIPKPKEDRAEGRTIPKLDSTMGRTLLADVIKEQVLWPCR